MARTLRAMTPDDITEAGELWRDAFRALHDSQGKPNDDPTPENIERYERRMRYLLGTDPDGSFVVVDESGIVGYASGHLRNATFTLANLAVRPDHQGDGIGRALLDAALTYAEGSERQLIFSSTDPRAFRRYLAAGFTMSPTAFVDGRARDDELTASLRRSDGCDADLDVVDEIDRVVRYGAVRDEVAFHLASGAELWLHPSGAYVAVSGQNIMRFGAVDETVGRVVLAQVLRGDGVGRPTGAGWITAHDQWALLAAVDAGATITTRGALMRRGAWGSPTAYLPNGLFG